VINGNGPPSGGRDEGVAVPSEHEKVSAVADRRYSLRLTQPPLQRMMRCIR